MDNIFILIILGVGAVILSVFLVLTGKSEQKPRHNLVVPHIKIFSITLSLVIILYLFRLLMILSTGIFSQYHQESLIGGAIACIPILLILIIQIKPHINKRSG